MFRTLVLALLAAPALALRMTMVREGMSKSVPFLKTRENLAGYVGGEAEFDPIGFSDFVPMTWLREAELKHGRVCMLATVGWIATDLGLRLPGPEHQFSSLEAHDALVAQGIMTQLAIFILPVELLSAAAIVGMMNGGSRKPGDYGFDPMNIQERFTPEKMAVMELKELKNGRLAMLGFSGMVTQAALTHHGFPYV